MKSIIAFIKDVTLIILFGLLACLFTILWAFLVGILWIANKLKT